MALAAHEVSCTAGKLARPAVNIQPGMLGSAGLLQHGVLIDSRATLDQAC